MHDVVIIGAGFTGLSAAQRLIERGADVLVLEARNRVGGRVEAQANGLGERADTGGQYLCEDMPEVTALAREFGSGMVESFSRGAIVMQPAMADEAAGAVFERATAIRDSLLDLDLADPALARLTVGEWLSGLDEPQEARDAFRSTIEGLWCQPIDALPLWYLADNDRRITNEVSELQMFPAGTMHGLAEGLAARLGDRLRLGRPVLGIERRAAGVRVRTKDGTLEARCAIVAVPPVAAQEIAQEPPLSDAVGRALAAWRSGTVVKARLRYARPFWREEGRSGMVFWLEPYGLFACDSSLDETRPAITVFVGGPLAVAWATRGEAALRATILARLAAALGPAAAEPLDLSLRDWSGDRWSGGGYGDVIVDIGARDAEGVLREGAWPVLFASSELSPSFPGYVEGAIVAGRAVAERALAGLDQSAIATRASGS